MYKNTVGVLHLSPLKDEGKFVFINNEVHVNGKICKGDSIKIFVNNYTNLEGRHLINETSAPCCKIVVRGEKIEVSLSEKFLSIEDLYNMVSDCYKNMFFFGKLKV